MVWLTRSVPPLVCGCQFVDAQQVVDGGGEFGNELEAVVGDDGGWASPPGDAAVDEVAGGIFGGAFGGGNSELVGAAADLVRENVGCAGHLKV